MKTVIIDDEINCTDVLQLLLQKYCKEVQIVGIFNDPVLALKFIQKSPPDLVLIDIEMPMMNGFQLLKELEAIKFKVIFTTAYDQYAIKAFKFNAIDYLLKPIDKEELIAAVNKSLNINENLLNKIEYTQYLKTNHIPERILLPIGNELIFVETANIICCMADGSYTYIHCLGLDKPYLLSKNLREIEELLNNPNFFRPHNSWLIQSKHIKKVIKSDAMELELTDKIRIPVARSKKQEIIELLNKIG